MMNESLQKKNMNNLISMYSETKQPCTFQESPCLLLVQQRPALFKGEFYFADFPSERREFWMGLHLDKQKHIYFVSRDSVGPFVCLGKKFSENSAKFSQKYFDDYEIFYECFYFSKDLIEGNWKTTNAKGHFLLKRETDFELEKYLEDSLEDLMILLRHPPSIDSLVKLLKLLDERMLKEVEEFEPFLQNSILSVMIHGAQGGVPERKIEKEFEAVEKLFEHYKNINLLSQSSENGSQQSAEDSIEEVDLREFNTSTSESVVISNRSTLTRKPPQQLDQLANAFAVEHFPKVSVD